MFPSSQALAYLHTMRTVNRIPEVPSLSARNELIRGETVNLAWHRGTPASLSSIAVAHSLKLRALMC